MLFRELMEPPSLQVFKTMWVGQLRIWFNGVVILHWWLDLTILEVFSNLKYSVILYICFNRVELACNSWYWSLSCILKCGKVEFFTEYWEYSLTKKHGREWESFWGMIAWRLNGRMIPSACVCRLMCVEVNLLQPCNFDIVCCLYILLCPNTVSCTG